jgi:hypothetical protein
VNAGAGESTIIVMHPRLPARTRCRWREGDCVTDRKSVAQAIKLRIGISLTMPFGFASLPRRCPINRDVLQGATEGLRAEISGGQRDAQQGCARPRAETYQARRLTELPAAAVDWLVWRELEVALSWEVKDGPRALLAAALSWAVTRVKAL